MTSEVVKAVTAKLTAFWDVTECNLRDKYLSDKAHSIIPQQTVLFKKIG
jgi:hypothetical protein